MSDPHKVLVDLDLSQSAILNALMDPRDDDPPSPVDGQIWYRTDLPAFRVYDNGAVETLAYVPENPPVIPERDWQLVGNGVSTSFPFYHGLQSLTVRVTVIDATDGTRPTVSVVTVPGSGVSQVEFEKPPASNEYRMIVTE